MDAFRLMERDGDVYAAPASTVAGEVVSMFPLARTFTNGVLRLSADVKAPAQWEGKPGNGTTIRVGLGQEGFAGASRELLGEFGPDLQSRGGTANFALVGNGVGGVHGCTIVSTCKPDVWNHYVVDFDLGARTFSGSVLSAAAGAAKGTFGPEPFCSAAVPLPACCVTLRACGVKGTQGGVDNLKLEWKAPGATTFETVFASDFTTRSGVAEPEKVPLAGVVPTPRPLVAVDFATVTGKVKPMHAVGQAPIYGGGLGFQLFHYLKEAGIPYSRLHDVGGMDASNRFVDIPNLFRDFDADENDPANYDFAFTDELLKGLVANGVEPYFRLGVTIENYYWCKAYRIHPPKDYAKWARICEHVIRHYNEGWANGFRHNITYWEIWNEPENNADPKRNQMWTGSWMDYMRLYEVTSKHLKKCFPHLKIGGYGSCGVYAITEAKPSENNVYRLKCVHDFLAYAKAKACPLDFFSFHSYTSLNPTLWHIAYVRKALDDAGFPGTEMHLNEWLPNPNHDHLGTALQAADICAEMVGMQQSALDVAVLYDARCGVGNYSPVFNPFTMKPHKAYFALKAFNAVYRLGSEVKCRTNGTADVYAMAARGEKGAALLVVNRGECSLPFTHDFGGRKPTSCLLTDDTHTNEKVELPSELSPRSFILVEF